MGIYTALLLVAVVLLICIGSSRLSYRLGVPVLFLFIVLGMIFGSDGVFGLPFDNYQLTEQVCSVALVFIMFYGGFGTSWKEARPVAAQAILLASLGVVLTAGITALFCFGVLGLSVYESLLIGSVISSTDAASVFSILRSKKLSLKHGLASLLELESGSNDPTSYMLTAIVLAAMGGRGQKNVPLQLLSQVLFGLAVGALVAVLATAVLSRVSFEQKGLHTTFLVAVALGCYALAQLLGGNGYLAVYVAGIVLGNSRILHKVELVHFFDGITWLAQVLIFFVLVLLAFPSQIPALLGTAVAITAFLSLVARPAATLAILSWFKVPLRQQFFVSMAGIRGAASIVFAVMAMNAGVPMRLDIFHIVFCVALFSVAVQGTLLPVLARKLGLVGDQEGGGVWKTFTDYQDQEKVQLIELPVVQGDFWCGKAVRDLGLPPELLITMIVRGEETVIPKGGTVIAGGDLLVLGGLGRAQMQALLAQCCSDPQKK